MAILFPKNISSIIFKYFLFLTVLHLDSMQYYSLVSGVHPEHQGHGTSSLSEIIFYNIFFYKYFSIYLCFWFLAVSSLINLTEVVLVDLNGIVLLYTTLHCLEEKCTYCETKNICYKIKTILDSQSRAWEQCWHNSHPSQFSFWTSWFDHSPQGLYPKKLRLKLRKLFCAKYIFFSRFVD